MGSLGVTHWSAVSFLKRSLLNEDILLLMLSQNKVVTALSPSLHHLLQCRLFCFRPCRLHYKMKTKNLIILFVFYLCILDVSSACGDEKTAVSLQLCCGSFVPFEQPCCPMGFWFYLQPQGPTEQEYGHFVSACLWCQSRGLLQEGICAPWAFCSGRELPSAAAVLCPSNCF